MNAHRLSAEELTAVNDKALRHLLALQKPGGDWEGEMVWCTMILSQTIIVRTVTGRPYSPAEIERIVRHYQVSQRDDGSFGMHPESPGYVFFTTLAYVALRLLGLPAEHSVAAPALRWLHAQPDGVKAIPSWGKFWLALLGLYPYPALNSIPPELFLLPEWLPFSPRRYYCHTRLIYLGIAVLFGMRFEARLPGSLQDDLRRELYGEAYEAKTFAPFRHKVAATDLFVPIHPLLRGVYDLLAAYERRPIRWLREKALNVCFEKILYEQRSSRYQGISPVNALLNCLAIFARDPKHPDLAPSLDGIEAWRWDDEPEGLRYCGARSNTWDTAFVLQALAEFPEPGPAAAEAAAKAQTFLDRAQMTEELPDWEAAWRDRSLGGWCFSDGVHRWPVSDCTAESLSALLSIYEHPRLAPADRLDDGRLREAAEFILSRQNRDGGFGTYERRRAGRLLEMINPSEMYGQCMSELSYIECTSSCLAALWHYRKHFPDLPGGELDRAMGRARDFLRNQQLADGSYPGFWGINYTYALFHVVRSLRLTGAAPDDPALVKAAGWLLEKQRPDGGWGEHYSSCLEERYVEHRESQVVMSSWALLALLEILPPEHAAIEKGIAWVAGKQQENGGWPRQAVNGVFFGAAMLDYRLYHTYFPVWALARYTRHRNDTPPQSR